MTCKEGTKITIPAKSFINVKTGKLARGIVNLEVTEYYKLSDMLLANLTTKSNKKQLETGGMLYLEANKKGEKLKLKPGKRIQMAFKSKGKKEMQLFSGEEHNNGVNWKLETQNKTFENIEEEDVEVAFSVVEKAPVFPGCEMVTEQRKRDCLKTEMNNFVVENFDKTIAEKLGLIGKHKISTFFKIRKDGSIVDLSIQAAHKDLANEMKRVVKSLPQLQPARQRKQLVRVPYYLPFEFRIGKSTKSNRSKIIIKSDTTYARISQAKLDSILNAIGLKNTKTFEKKLDSLGVYGVLTSEIDRYVFSTTKLGWINCDRFLRFKGRKIKYKVKIKNSKGANVKMIFKSVSSILPAKNYNDEFHFGSIPINADVVLIAIKKENNKLFLGKKEIKIETLSQIDLNFKEVTIQELKNEFEVLNTSF